jgi:hypothetical protein
LGIDDFRKVFVVQLKNFGANFHTNPAGNTFALIYDRKLWHGQTPLPALFPFSGKRLSLSLCLLFCPGKKKTGPGGNQI